MPSKMILRRQKSARDVEAGVRIHSRTAEDAVHRVLAPFLEDGESPPPLEALQRLCGRALQHHRQELVQRDEAHLRELRGDGTCRHRRDTAARTVLDSLVQIRDSFQGVFGTEAAKALLGLGGAMTRDPVVLARKGRRVLEILSSESLRLPPPLLPGWRVDITGWAEALEPSVSELEAALQEVAFERRDAEATMLAKKKAIEDYDRIFLKVAHLMESLYRLGDLDRLAARVRPSTRRAGQTAQLAGSPFKPAQETSRETAPEAALEAEPAQSFTPEPLRLVVPAS